MVYNFILNTSIRLSSFLQRVQFFARRKLRYAQRDKILDQNIVFKDKYKGKKCYIIGNGPSLAKQDLSLLADEYVFVVNSFFLHEQIKVIKPDFYVFADPISWNVADKEVIEWWTNLVNRSGNLEINYLLPVQLKGTFVQNLLSKEKTFFLDISLPFYPGAPYKYDMTLPVNGTQNVLAMCMQAAIYMGFEEIYLLGADHDWLSTYGGVGHFYDSSKVKLNEVSKALQHPYYWWTEVTNTMFWQYREVNNYAKSKGVQIFNASEAGVLDVFPFIRFKDSLSKDK